jgi:hypothetical protein
VISLDPARGIEIGEIEIATGAETAQDLGDEIVPETARVRVRVHVHVREIGIGIGIGAATELFKVMIAIGEPQIRIGGGIAQRPGAREGIDLVRIGTALAPNIGKGKEIVRVRGPEIVIANGTEIEMWIRTGIVRMRKIHTSRTGIVILPEAAGHMIESAHIHVHILL